MSALTTTTDPRVGREIDPRETLRQIGVMNVMAISGGRWSTITTADGTAVGVEMPVGSGYRVRVLLDASDTYIVQRVFERAGREWIKGECTDIYADDVGEQAYQASSFRSYDYPKGEA